MEKLRKMGCWGCDSLDVIGWGKQNGKQRFKCKSCGLLFTRNNPALKADNRFVWFEKWILGKQTLDQLVKQSKYSERSLRIWFDAYLKHYPLWEIIPSEKVNLLIDGTYFANKVCLIVYRDNNIKVTQLYRVTDNEWFEEIVEDLRNLILLGVQIESVTCDGHPSILKAIKETDQRIIIQRCIIHIQRMCRIWLTQRPQSQAGYELRQIISVLHLIETKDQWAYWVMDLVYWSERHHVYLHQKSFSPQTGRYWYTHKMVRKSFVTIRRALPNMFHYLDNPSIPKSTNGLESFFGHLKQNISLHRGLSKEHFKNYLKWYLYFNNNRKR